MTDRFRVLLAQYDPTVGDIAGNAEKIDAAAARAAEQDVDLALFPEMFLIGYQPQDLVLKPAVVAACRAALERIARRWATGPALLVGAPEAERAGPDGRSTLYNAMFLLERGEIVTTFRKAALPNYGVFDEKRLYAAGAPGPFSVRGVRIGVPVCEDAWGPEVCETLEESGAEILLTPNGSPYSRDKHDRERLPAMVARVVETGLPLAYLNMAGAQDDQVFDGQSFVLNPGGGLAAMAPAFEEAELVVDFVRGPDGFRAADGPKATPPDAVEADYRAMVAGVGAYIRKNGFSDALIGLSGGVDSALAAAVAVDALGPDHVRTVMLPSRFTSAESLEDAEAVAARLGCRLDTLPIGPSVSALEAALAPFFEGRPRDLTEENLQSRLRGLFLMALSNKTGALLLTTGNKSEVAVGYSTLYGDMCGAYNPLKDLYKTRVFEVCRWRSATHRPWMKGPAGPVIPPRVIDKPPSAELREDQKDEDSLPPYAELDAILERLIEQDQGIDDIVEAGFDRETVEQVERLIYLSEYKRHQAAPGPKLTEKAFWLDRRYPLTNRFRDRR